MANSLAGPAADGVSALGKEVVSGKAVIAEPVNLFLKSSRAASLSFSCETMVARTGMALLCPRCLVFAACQVGETCPSWSSLRRSLTPEDSPASHLLSGPE